MRSRRLWLLGALSFSLAGCGLGKVAPAPKELDLGSPPAAETISWRFDAIALPVFNQSKQVGLEDVIWRLGDDGAPNRYATYRWSAPPARLVRERLFEQLSLHGAVLTESINSEMPQLRVTLMQFEQIYRPDGSTNEGRVTLQAVFIRDGQVLGQFLGSQAQEASANTAPAGAAALRIATDRLIDRLTRWLSEKLREQK
ncbi:MAG: ABC-type transport auxiliary lipoprotein family protein [Burkholderiaceae bacterium]|nr:ABC-type transport auxiliary lipoprotein family protein [Burkholderiaceae bacterium]MCD8517904.1 ABC-type transport auxiliary lipoprotein family protein [Burkholderiaceae bacterium]MCD8536522.1 ABC-type transport auxiliary lipoprotein family protein [Burkholderiaceae bacterium]MCD8565356.1 ABC-type transport auxiliary lipoprotein family protein [Burkholderiaceae bacterium]